MFVITKYGSLEGEEIDQIAVFKGIPYAKPPVGDLRWKAPQPPDAWKDVRKAVEFGNASAQPVFEQNYADGFLSNKQPMSEDCLYLNIWTPKLAVDAGKSLPVLFVVHGGGFKFFSSAMDVLNGEELAKRDIVVVSINYRLGVMGFFAHPDLSKENPYHVSGNYALLDQIAALKWVRDNIASFGGDPRQITFCGESAGAFCGSVLYSSPLAKGLFHRITAQSGAFMDNKTLMYKLQTLEETEAYFSKLFADRSLKELRSMSWENLVEQTKPVSFSPICDGHIFQKDNKQALKNGLFNDVPLLIGSNCDEGTLFSDQSGDPEKFAAMAVGLFGKEKAAEFLKIYPNNSKEETIRSQIQLVSDSVFGHNMYSWAKLQVKNGTSNVYLYYYCRVPPNSKFGAYHSSELSYFYHNLIRSKRNWTQKDYELENIYSKYILNFVKTGNPNDEGLPKWDLFSADDEKIMILDDDPHMGQNPALSAMLFWDANA
jgi:para-nitrobenzyl esterase